MDSNIYKYYFNNDSIVIVLYLTINVISEYREKWLKSILSGILRLKVLGKKLLTL